MKKNSKLYKKNIYKQKFIR